MLRTLDLFSGIGGFALAAHWMGWQTTQFVEINPFCQQVLTKNFPDIPIHHDIKTFTANQNEYDIILGGSPCQNFSLQGDRTGITGSKSVLFFEYARLVQEIRPQGFVLENVVAIGQYLPQVLQCFKEIGDYECRWFRLSASSLGGVHQRNRFFLVGYRTIAQEILHNNQYSSNGKNSQSENSHCGLFYEFQANEGKTSSLSGKSNTMAELPDRRQERSESEYSVCGASNGLPFKLDFTTLMNKTELERYWWSRRTRDYISRADDVKQNKRMSALGNTVTPQQAFVALNVLKNCLDLYSN
jgi:DNA (cytosine-5)-methyltransferase 1